MNLKDAELAQAMLDYQRKWEELKELEAFIVGGVLERGESQKVARVVATYYNPKKEVDYEAAAKSTEHYDFNMIVEANTTYKPAVSWKGVAAGVKANLENFTTDVPARVIVKVKE